MSVPAWARGSLLLALTFVAGLAIGAGYERRHLGQPATVSVEAHDVMQRLTGNLDLDSTQQQAIAAVLARHQSEVDSTWHAMQPHLRADLDSMQQEIGALLRPDQLRRFQDMLRGAHPANHR